MAKLKLVEHNMRDAFLLLRWSPPFSDCGFPCNSAIHFYNKKNEYCIATHELRDDVHHISMDLSSIGSLNTLLFYMAHEMVHMLIEDGIHGYGPNKDKTNHGPLFRRISKAVCDAHGFDYKLFILGD